MSAARDWTRLQMQTDGLTRPAVLRGFFDTVPIDEAEVLRIFRRVGARHTGQLMTTLRAYQGGRRERLEHRVLSTPPEESDTLRAWYDATFEGEPSALILNRVERWSATVANLAAGLNRALAGGDESRLHDVECVLFIGDYGFSPFGAHLDYDSTKVIHIPLSADPKTMFLWTERDFEGATGARTPCFSPERILGSAERHEFRAGDLFFLPADRYHVGHTPTLTTTLAIVLTQHTRPRHHLDSLPAALSARFGESWATTAAVRGLRLDEMMRLSERYSALRRASNLGLSASLEYRPAPLPDDRDVQLRVVSPFTIHHEQTDGVAVHVRGSSFFVNPTPTDRHLEDIRCLFEVLNTGEALSVRLAAHVAKTLHVDAVAHLIGMLVDRHVLAQAE